jgi:hypothetical protein
MPMGASFFYFDLSATPDRTQLTDPPTLTITAATNNTALCSGSSASLTANGSGGTGAFSYSWSSGGASSTEVVIPTSTTNYSVTAFDANNCSISTSITQTVVICTNINKSLLNNTDILLYPNPANNLLYINTPLFSDKTYFVIYNSLGQVVLSQAITQNSQQISLANFCDGLYNIVVFNSSESIYSAKIIKE